jgi:membrane-bound ClpP family serine protease
MTPTLLAALLLSIGMLLLVAELVVPTHGTLAIAGVSATVGAVAACFAISFYAGMGALTAAVLLMPIAGRYVVHIWPHTPVGRKLILQPSQANSTNSPSLDTMPTALAIGMTGTAISELRPMGICQFGDSRVEARAAHGLIPAGSGVRIIELNGGHAVVRDVRA